MRVIQVTDEDCCELLESLELARYRGKVGAQDVLEGMPDDQRLAALHRHFHYVVCGWLQKHGANPRRD